MIIETYGKTYTCDPQEIGENERKFLDYIKSKILLTSDYTVNLVINLTWFFPESDTEELLTWIKSKMIKGDTKVYLVASVDGGYWFTNSITYPLIQELVSDIELVGFGPNQWSSWMPSWMSSYDEDELSLSHAPRYAYLSYNRKPRLHRENLVRAYIDNDILRYGWVTYERGVFNEVDMLSGQSDSDIYSQDTRYSRPEDLTTLGNMDVWRNSYCVIVSETDPTDPWQISEKTWKPILGMRPYLINGNSNLNNILRDLGFMTPSDLFENKDLDNSRIEDIVEYLKVLCAKEPNELYHIWTRQYGMLLHNKNRFKQLANEWNFDY